MKSLFLSVLLFGSCVIARGDDIPKGGYVPNEQVAIGIAEAVLVPIAGQDAINREKPFHAELQNGIWVVSGTIEPGRKVGKIIYLTTGGPWEVRVSKASGQIFSATWQK